MRHSISELRDCAPRHLAEFTDESSGFAFTAYDTPGIPDRLDQIDCLAPALLNAPIKAATVIAMNRPGTPEARLLATMRELIADPLCSTATFLESPIDGPALTRVINTLAAPRDVPHVKASKVSKILHRKRPHLVPLLDSRVTWYFTGSSIGGADPDVIRGFCGILRTDLKQNETWLAPLAAVIQTRDGRTLSLLRAADIIVWHHLYSKCPGGG